MPTPFPEGLTGVLVLFGGFLYDFDFLFALAFLFLDKTSFTIFSAAALPTCFLKGSLDSKSKASALEKGFAFSKKCQITYCCKSGRLSGW